ncbi:hypothetical protein CXB51_009251 [Gossypium anomalum]|uniref:DUF7745 domain-containing protein n=1 Tax=Gossypium anomalum TaxID=47600 RepID=A0A8J6D293_9ROSI|nr:hypothetical protein CXB51_009251 [Gossypium anomalum]
MESGFFDKVEDNAAVRIWAETTQQEKGDSLTEGYVSELSDFTRVSVTQNNLQEMKEIWAQWDDEVKRLFYCHYGDLPYLLDVKIDERLFRALVQYWNSAYSCFTFGNVDLVPTIEEYTALIRCPKIQVDRIYSKAASGPAFSKKLMNITGMSEQWVTARIRQKGDCRCIPWRHLRDLILAHPDTKKRVDVFALSIYGLVIFPKALGHIDEAVSDLFDRLSKGTTPVPAILAETFKSLNACRRAGEGRFIGCAQLLLSWFHSHFWKAKKVSYRVFSENYSPLKELVATPRRDDITEENWMAILQNLQEEDVEWRAPWMVPDEVLYRCGDFDWVPLLGVWGAIGYAPLLVLRQYRSRQFTPPTHRLAQCEFAFTGNNYKRRVREISNAWNQTRRMKKFAANPMATPEYDQWRIQRINDNIPMPDQEGPRSMEECLRPITSELEIVRHDFERKRLELEKRIEQLEEEKMQLGLDVDVQKLEAERLRKGKNKAEEDLDSLKTDYKKLRRSMRIAGLGKTSEQWRQEIKEEQRKASQWEEKFREAQAREETLKESLAESQNEKERLKMQLKGKIEELKVALQDRELQLEFLEINNDRLNEQLHQSQEQVRNRDYIMSEALNQVREVADHLQTLAVQADVLSLKYELESDRGRELAWLLRQVKALSIRAKPYM